MNKDMFKKLGAYAILGTVATGLMTFLPPMFQASSYVFGLGQKYSNLQETLSKHSTTLTSHQDQITIGRGDMKEFRSVWCLDRLSSPGKVNPHVLETCSRWIKSP